MLATFADFTARHDADPSEQPTIEALLGDASALILAEVRGSEETWVVEETDAPAAVVSVAVEVAYRAWSNPDALGRAAAADISHSWRGDGPDAVYLTAEEKRRVRRAAGVGSFRAMTLESPYSGPVLSDPLGEIQGE